MIEVPNDSSVHTYTRQIAEKVLAAMPPGQTFLEGEQLLQLSPIKQLNLMVIRILQMHWHYEAEKLKSPYFNYQAQPVQKAFQQLLNTLSQHIHIAQPEALELVQQATTDCLFLIANPPFFFAKAFEEIQIDQMIHLPQLRELSKYIVVHKAILRLFTERWHQKLSPTYLLPLGEAKEWLAQLFANHSHEVEPMDDHLAQFHQWVPMPLSALLSEIQQPQLPTTATTTTTTTPEKDPQVSPVNSPTASVWTEQVKPSQSLVEKFQQKKFNNLRTAITLNQKFLFVRQLFQGNMNDFEQALARIEQCSTLDEVTQLLQQTYAAQYGWDFESEAATELMALLVRRFE
ncbi:MAG TPA: hypothetical protein DCM08_08685 [Microscillaceae bacterium]|jgi:hypothetical protein|nr:hypothetical protein [Microscillaceae bacterium]